MRKFSLVALFVLLCGMYAVAQDYSKAEFFAGYQYLHIDCGSGCTVASWPAGFDLDGTYYFTRILGLTADFDYNKKTLGTVPANAIFPGSPEGNVDARAFGLHFGPRVKARIGKVEPFGQALFGFTDLGGSALGVNASDKAFSMKLGGGLDVSAARHFAVRLGEFNLYLTRFGSATQKNFTFAAGIVIR